MTSGWIISIVCISLVCPEAQLVVDAFYPRKADCERVLEHAYRVWIPDGGAYTFNCIRGRGPK